MSHRKKLALRAAAPVAVLALALTGCNGDDKAEGAKGGAAGAAKETGGAEKPPADGAGGAGGAGEAAGKKELGTGEAVTSPFKEKEAGQVTYEIVAQKVDVGTEADAKKMVDDPAKAKGLVPVVAHVKYTHKSGKPVADYPDVGDNVEIHADGARGGLLIGASDDAPGCESDSDIENWKPGQSHVICETYMIPKGAKEIEVHWAADDDSTEPFIWKFKGA
ncbi:hypothetical protein ACH4SP_32365 [Streptomyces sp. NPDC021093]|uniref:hypothetical protein n=1 Tax=Streptomyces sp. NPDC021093 TaxID=3365112 RepID=UPI00378C437C